MTNTMPTLGNGLLSTLLHSVTLPLFQNVVAFLNSINAFLKEKMSNLIPDLYSALKNKFESLKWHHVPSKLLQSVIKK